MRKGRDLTQGKPSRVIMRFALPMMIGNIFQQLYNVVDSMIVGKYIGTAALSATGVSFPILFMLSSIIIGFAIGGTILISQFYGAKNYKNVVKASETLQLTMLSIASVMAIIGVLSSKWIFKALNFPEENLDMAVTYFNILMVGYIAMFGFNSLTATLRGLGDSQTPVYFLIFSTLINLTGDLVFVLVFDWGIKGVAWATVIANFSMYFAAIIYLNTKHKLVRIKLKMNFDKNIFKKILKLGLPSSGQMFIVSMGQILIFGIINLFGTEVIAGYTAAGRINSFAIMPAMFFSNALTAFVGQNYGAKKYERIKSGLIATMKIIGAISIIISLIALLFSKQLMGFFTNDAKVIEIGVQYFKIVSPFYIAFGMMFSLNAIYRGISNTVIPMYFTLISLWFVRFPVSIIFSMDIQLHPLKFMPSNSTGIWWGEPFGWTTGFILALIYYLSNKWKKQAGIEIS